MAGETHQPARAPRRRTPNQTSGPRTIAPGHGSLTLAYAAIAPSLWTWDPTADLLLLDQELPAAQTGATIQAAIDELSR